MEKILDLTGNNLAGTLPPELGDLASLAQAWLNSNQLSGNIPVELINLTTLQTGGLDIQFNHLYTYDGSLRTLLGMKQLGGGATTAPTARRDRR